jgi:hypothetical protein
MLPEGEKALVQAPDFLLVPDTDLVLGEALAGVDLLEGVLHGDRYLHLFFAGRRGIGVCPTARPLGVFLCV